MSKKNPEPQNNNNVFDLTQVLSKPVAQSNPDPLFELDPENDIVDVQFDEEPVTETVQVDEPQEDQGSFASAKDIAESIVNLLDGLQSTAIPYLLEKRTFNEKEQELLQTLDKSGHTVYTPEKSAENLLLKKWQKFKKTVDMVPFSNGEIRRLVNATMRYVEITNMKVTPFQQLMISYSEVIVKRSALFFTV